MPINPVRWAYKVAVTPGYWSVQDVTAAKAILEDAIERRTNPFPFYRGLVNAALLVAPFWTGVACLGGWWIWG